MNFRKFNGEWIDLGSVKKHSIAHDRMGAGHCVKFKMIDGRTLSSATFRTRTEAEEFLIGVIYGK
jgi:hypothetical protein